MAASLSARAGVDFTPAVNRYFNEGAEYSNVSFKDDKRTVTLILPRLWSCRGDSARLQLVPPNQNFAEGIIEAVETKGVMPFDEANLKALEQRVLNMVPPGTDRVTLASRQENPVILNQNLSYEFVVTYQTLGQTFQRSVIFVNCPGEQLIFRFSAPQSAFDDLFRSFRQSLSSWNWSDAPAAPVTASK